MTHLIKILSLTLYVVLLSVTISFAQEDSSKSHMHHDHKMEMKKGDHKNMDMKDHKNMMKGNKQVEESIVREGEIDLLSIDKNGDGKVFQDQMDWNVISDEPGKCPLCEMKLKEVTINEAKFNLIKNGFQVKSK